MSGSLSKYRCPYLYKFISFHSSYLLSPPSRAKDNRIHANCYVAYGTTAPNFYLCLQRKFFLSNYKLRCYFCAKFWTPLFCPWDTFRLDVVNLDVFQSEEPFVQLEELDKWKITLVWFSLHVQSHTNKENILVWCLKSLTVKQVTSVQSLVKSPNFFVNYILLN